MVSKKKKSKNILIALGIIFLILFIGIFSFRNAVVGVGQELKYSNEWKINDLQTGNEVTEATLKIPTGTNSISFTVDYEIDSYYRSSADPKIDVKYEVFNYNTNSYETVHQKSWELKNYDSARARLRMDGESVYISGIPEQLESIRTSSSSYDKYYGCLDVMTVSEAKELNPWTEGTKSYTYKCLYPESSIVKHEYGDDADEGWDVEYFPRLITLDQNYINESEILLRISVNVKSSGIDSLHANDFSIDLWEVKTNTVDIYSFDGTSCNYQAKYTYQVAGSDYFTRNECEYENSIIQCYLDEQCSTEKEGYVADCSKNICTEERDVWWNNILPEKQEPIKEEVKVEKEKTGSFVLLIIPITILILIALIIRNIRKQNVKKR